MIRLQVELSIWSNSHILVQTCMGWDKKSL